MIGKKRGGASAKIIEAMFQKPKGLIEEEDDEEEVVATEMDMNVMEEKIIA